MLTLILNPIQPICYGKQSQSQSHFVNSCVKARSHGAIFNDCDCVFYIACTFFISHVMGCIDVNDPVQTVRLRSSVI